CQTEEVARRPCPVPVGRERPLRGGDAEHGGRGGVLEDAYDRQLPDLPGLRVLDLQWYRREVPVFEEEPGEVEVGDLAEAEGVAAGCRGGVDERQARGA